MKTKMNMKPSNSVLFSSGGLNKGSVCSASTSQKPLAFLFALSSSRTIDSTWKFKLTYYFWYWFSEFYDWYIRDWVIEKKAARVLKISSLMLLNDIRNMMGNLIKQNHLCQIFSNTVCKSIRSSYDTRCRKYVNDGFFFCFLMPVFSIKIYLMVVLDSQCI